MELETRLPEDLPAIEPLVIISPKGKTQSEIGIWDGKGWVDQNGFPADITAWCEFPSLKKPATRRLLILGCSMTKNHQSGKIPAIERYTGVYYQTLHAQPGPRPEIVILSAEFGFIGPSTQIPDYDRRMDQVRAAELLPGASLRLGAILRQEEYDEVLIAAGKEYRDVIMPALKGCMGAKFHKVGYAKGGIGTQRKQLKEWLAAA